MDYSYAEIYSSGAGFEPNHCGKSLTVGELIVSLSQMPPDCPVIVCDGSRFRAIEQPLLKTIKS